MKYLILFLSLTITSLASSQTATDTVDCMTLLKTSDFAVVKTIQEIAPWVFLKFPEWEKMSNPGKKFNTTEKKGSSPKRRLFFAAHSGDNWIVSYEHGGRDYHAHCIFLTVNERHELVVFDACNEFTTFDDLKMLAATIEVPFEIWDGHEY